jgi:hypothetical protein
LTLALLKKIREVLKSISNPLKNIKKIKPNVDNMLSILSLCTRFKKDCPINKRNRQGTNKHEKDVPSHLNLALTVFAFIMIISVILAYAL